MLSQSSRTNRYGSDCQCCSKQHESISRSSDFNFQNHLLSYLLVEEFSVENCPGEIERVRCGLEINQSNVFVFWIVYFKQPHLNPCIIRISLVGEISAIELQINAAFGMHTTLRMPLRLSLRTSGLTPRWFILWQIGKFAGIF
ncbi:hypothetical protein TTRE_0000981601 [Trichuris trichiura]|uniref:Uncharacterized protein n=1 Tax=Trichuris trichiura TaxID=36087 RepID=A0A077ZM02_TRITR|nr:hypothetical protein TTRE_0000981601 [Trichuris trichiura]